MIGPLGWMNSSHSNPGQMGIQLSSDPLKPRNIDNQQSGRTSGDNFGVLLWYPPEIPGFWSWENDILPGWPVLIPFYHNQFPEIWNSQASQAEMTFCLAGLCSYPVTTIFSGKFLIHCTRWVPKWGPQKNHHLDPPDHYRINWSAACLVAFLNLKFHQNQLDMSDDH